MFRPFSWKMQTTKFHSYLLSCILVRGIPLKCNIRKEQSQQSVQWQGGITLPQVGLLLCNGNLEKVKVFRECFIWMTSASFLRQKLILYERSFVLSFNVDNFIWVFMTICRIGRKILFFWSLCFSSAYLYSECQIIYAIIFC